jgi:hypothetical protein
MFARLANLARRIESMLPWFADWVQDIEASAPVHRVSYPLAGTPGPI